MKSQTLYYQYHHTVHFSIYKNMALITTVVQSILKCSYLLNLGVALPCNLLDKL